MWMLLNCFLLLGLVALKDIPLAQGLEEGCVNIYNGMPPKPKVIPVRSKGILVSPGFLNNQNYPDNIVCAYQLQTAPGLNIRIHFNSIDIDATDLCRSDSLRIFDFNAQGQGVLRKTICGNQLPYDFVSQSHALQIVFQTDDFATKTGFNITYWLQNTPDVCPSGKMQCRNRMCVDSFRICDGNDDCGDGTDEERCLGVGSEVTDCGVQDVSPVALGDYDRIVGGRDAVPGSWPWTVSLQIAQFEPSGHVCGGSLINSQWIVTASHCFTNPGSRRPSDWRIHIGNYHKFEKDDYEQVRYVERIIIHEDIPPHVFEENGLFNIEHDLALIKLSAPVKFTKHVKPVCLPEPFVNLNTSLKCYATGWGMTRGTGFSDRLKQTLNPIQPAERCRSPMIQRINSETMICAGSLASLNGICHGDSGGPLVCELKPNVWTLVGLSSFGIDGTGTEGLCGFKNHPSVFNRLSAKIAYINRMINKYS